MFDFSVFPTLATDRLVLREIIMEDAEAVFRIRGDGEVTRWNTGAPYLALGEAKALLRQMIVCYEKRTELRWGITLAGEDDVIGMVGYNTYIRPDRRGSIGYDLARAYWGKGIMAEALKAVLAFGFTTMELNRIEADVSLGNDRSIRLLERLGFTREGQQREQYFDLEENRFHDLLLYGLLKREWEQQQIQDAPQYDLLTISVSPTGESGILGGSVFAVDAYANGERMLDWLDVDTFFHALVERGRLPVFNCSCGCFGCGGYYVAVEDAPGGVLWRNRYYTTSPKARAHAAFRYLFSWDNLRDVAEELIAAIYLAAGPYPGREVRSSEAGDIELTARLPDFISACEALPR